MIRPESIPLSIEGLPEQLSSTESAIWRSRFLTPATNLARELGLTDLRLMIASPLAMAQMQHSQSANGKRESSPGRDELTKEQRADQYVAREPRFGFDFLIVPDSVRDELLRAVDLLELEKKVFDEWGLRKIEPFPRTALNFHGPPGTGKSLAAHALAKHLGRKILVASYAQIESKYHGDGPKNVESIFYAAERDNAVLFIDEADSLLSRRLTSVTQGSEQAINSMRSQLLISLEQFKGVVIFATNLITNYDRAFETRVRSVHFPMPDAPTRREIWRVHLYFDGGPPLAPDVSLDDLAALEELCGRDIRNALIDAALKVARSKECIAQSDLLDAVQRIKRSRYTGTTAERPSAELNEKILQAVREQEAEIVDETASTLDAGTN